MLHQMHHVYYMIPWTHPSTQPKRHLDQFSHFCTAQSRESHTLQCSSPFLVQNCRFAWGSGPPSNACFSGPTQLHNRTTFWSVQQFLQGLRSWQIERLTDRQRYSVCNSRPHVHISTAMRPNNNHNNYDNDSQDNVYRVPSSQHSHCKNSVHHSVWWVQTLHHASVVVSQMPFMSVIISVRALSATTQPKSQWSFFRLTDGRKLGTAVLR